MIRTLGIILLFGVIFVGLQSVYTVNELQQALILRVGEPVDAVNEVGDEDPGLHFKLPFVMDVLMFDKRNLEFARRKSRRRTRFVSLLTPSCATGSLTRCASTRPSEMSVGPNRVCARSWMTHSAA